MKQEKILNYYDSFSEALENYSSRKFKRDVRYFGLTEACKKWLVYLKEEEEKYTLPIIGRFEKMRFVFDPDSCSKQLIVKVITYGDGRIKKRKFKKINKKGN